MTRTWILKITRMIIQLKQQSEHLAQPVGEGGLKHGTSDVPCNTSAQLQCTTRQAFTGTSWRNSSNLNSCWRVIISRCYYYPQVCKMPLKQNAGVIWWFVTQTFRLRGKRMTELARDISKKEKRRILWARTGDHDSVNLTIMKNCEEKMNRKLLTRTQILQSNSKKTQGSSRRNNEYNAAVVKCV